jgi:hypothetical protein
MSFMHVNKVCNVQLLNEAKEYKKPWGEQVMIRGLVMGGYRYGLCYPHFVDN